MRFLFLPLSILLLFIFFTFFSTPGYSANRRALVIAIDTYQEAAIRPLGGSVNDGNAVVGLLKKRLGFVDKEILYLKNEQATRQAILDGMDNWLVKGTQPGDKVFIYFAGHGYYLPDISGDERDEVVPRDEAICPYDTDPEAFNNPDNEKQGNLIIDDEIGERMARLQGRQVVSIFDSCHAGTSTRALVRKDIEGVRALNLVMKNEYSTIAKGESTSRGLKVKLVGPRPQAEGIHSWSEEINDASAYSVFLAAAGPSEQAREITSRGKKHGALTFALLNSFLRHGEETSLNHVVHEFSKIRHSYTILSQHPQIEGNSGLSNRSLRDIFAVNYASRGGDLAYAAINANESINLKLSVNDGKSDYQVNDILVFTASSSENGFLYIFDYIHASGDMYMIYPNVWSKLAGMDNRISAGERVRIPPEKSAGKPVNFQFYSDKPGRETIIGIITRKKWADMDSVVGSPTGEVTPLNREQTEMIRDLLFKRQSGCNLITSKDDPLFKENDWAGGVISIKIQ